MSAMNEKDIAARLNDLAAVRADPAAEVRDLDRVRQSLTGREDAAAPPRRRVLRISPAARMARFAAAALVAAALLIGVGRFGGSGLAWAEVAARVRSAPAVTYRITTSMTGTPTFVARAIDSRQYGSRVDIYLDGKLLSRMYAPRDAGETVTVIPEAKRYMRIRLDPERRNKQSGADKDPREFVQLFLDKGAVELGVREIDGVEARGLETSGPEVGGGMFDDATGRLWVDVKTGWPVRMEIEGRSAGGEVATTMVMDEFRWDEPLDVAELQPEIPDDYVLQSQTTLPPADETTLVKGLRAFAEISGGRYPSRLSFTTVSHELREALLADPERKRGPEGAQVLQDVTAASAFYTRLVGEEVELEYHGDSVSADDVDAVLMRWRVSETEYRVVYGDLRVETVADADALLDQAAARGGVDISPDKRALVARMLRLNEEDLVRGLRVWLELLDGRYPESLEPKAAMRQADALLNERLGGDASPDEAAKAAMESRATDIFLASAFYDKLVREDRKPVYCGRGLSQGDGSRVLLRWQASDGRERVIRCDLSRETLTSEQVAEQEAAAGR